MNPTEEINDRPLLAIVSGHGRAPFAELDVVSDEILPTLHEQDMSAATSTSTDLRAVTAELDAVPDQILPTLHEQDMSAAASTIIQFMNDFLCFWFFIV